MTNAELTAYDAGFKLARQAATEQTTVEVLTTTDRAKWPVGSLEALNRLGSKDFAYWVLRGCNEALGLSAGEW